MQSITIGTNQAGQRFDKFLHKYLPGAPGSLLYKMLRKKNITLNGKKAQGQEILQSGDEVRMFFSQETFEKFTGGSCDASGIIDPVPPPALLDVYQEAYRKLQGIRILYEDDHALILHKPAGILTQKASPGDLSLNEWMIGYLLKTGSITAEELHSFKPSVCNRLDRNTSGLVLCGKSLAGSQALSRLIHDRAVRKFYRTVVIGKIEQPCRIEGLLQKNDKTNTVRVQPLTGSHPSTGDVKRDNVAVEKHALIQTAYQPLLVTDTLTYLEVELITGKTHQIRAHLASIGHPLIGDPKYGDPTGNRLYEKKYHLCSQLLHAYRLKFPVLSGTLSGLSEQNITDPLPESFICVLKEMEA